MSALIAVNAGDAIHVLTDGASTFRKNGVVAVIHPKQIATPFGAVIAGMGLWRPTVRFAELANEQAKTFDEMVAIAPELWDDAKATVSTNSGDVPYSTVLAGWSEERARLEMHVLQERMGEGSGLWSNGLAYAVGPDYSAGDLVLAFVKRFGDDRQPFDAHRDGVGLFQVLRRHHPKKFDDGAQRAAVGGFVTCTVVTREGIDSSTIHEWPSDSVGQLIDASKVGMSTGKLRDAARSLLGAT